MDYRDYVENWSRQELAAYNALESAGQNVPLSIIEKNLRDAGMRTSDIRRTVQAVVDTPKKKTK